MWGMTPRLDLVTILGCTPEEAARLLRGRPVTPGEVEAAARVHYDWRRHRRWGPLRLPPPPHRPRVLRADDPQGEPHLGDAPQGRPQAARPPPVAAHRARLGGAVDASPRDRGHRPPVGSPGHPDDGST